MQCCIFKAALNNGKIRFALKEKYKFRNWKENTGKTLHVKQEK